MLLELVEAVPPHLAVRFEPIVEFDERFGAEAVEAPLTIGADCDQPRVAQHPQMFGDSRLTDCQPLNEDLNRLLSASQLVEDVAPARLSNHLDRPHDLHILEHASRDIYLSRHITRWLRRLRSPACFLRTATIWTLSDIRIYHNPACKHSRGALEILEERAPETEVVLYLETPPSKAELERLLALLEDPPADLVRKDKRFVELGLVESDYLTREHVVAVLMKHPELMQRPIIVKSNRAVLARPAEKVLTLLDPAPPGTAVVAAPEH
jgi:arsenate reductase (glutaredoxin)